MSRSWIYFTLGIALAAGLAAGLWATPDWRRFMEPAMAGLMILAGLVLILQRAPRRVVVMGSAFVLGGAANLLPHGTAALTLQVIALTILFAAAIGIPRRLFAD